MGPRKQIESQETPHRSTAASAKSSNDPASARLTPLPKTSAAQWNRPLARRSLAPNQSLQNIPPAVIENKPRRHRWSPVVLGVKSCALLLRKLVELFRFQ